jgi:hypothetical protein
MGKGPPHSVLPYQYNIIRSVFQVDLLEKYREVNQNVTNMPGSVKKIGQCRKRYLRGGENYDIIKSIVTQKL